jgi:methylmalonyl-CoA/ethylmalonyl-CoA epimerase
MPTSDDESPVYKLDHAAFGVPRVADAVPLLVGALGGAPHEGGPGFGFEGGQWRFAGGGLLEVIEPSGPPGGFLHRFLASRGAGIHHVTFKVPSLRAAADRARRFGYEVVGYNDAFAGWKECFLHPRQAHGIVVQLAESDPSFEGGEWTRSWPFPPAPAVVPPPARIVGLRLVLRSADTARRQWGEMLCGETSREDGALVFRWKESPLRIAVDVEPGAREEGPSCVEVAADRPLALPEGPVPELGACFRQLAGSA